MRKTPAVMTPKARVEIKQLEASQLVQDDVLAQTVLIKRSVALADKLRSARNATKLYQHYKSSPEQFRMTFAEFKKTRREV